MDDSLLEPLGDRFRVSDAVNAGATPEQLRTRTLYAPFWGIRSRIEVRNLRERAEAFMPRMPDRAFYFGPTAAGLHGIPLPPRKVSDLLHIGVVAGERRVDARGVVAHHVIIDARDVMLVDGIPVTTPARTWCDLSAGGLLRHEVVAIGDHLIGGEHPLATTTELLAALARYEGRRGSKLMRDALPVLNGDAASVRETWLRVLIIDAGLPEPVVQCVVVNRWGRKIGRCDLGWPQLRIGIEYEGDHHRTDREQWQYDIRRYREMEEAGWLIIRVTAADFADAPARDRLIRRLRSAISARVRTSGVN
ncbi:endonuclease domain-containing protein [Protaetiibacter larvae]|uniref:DUF559 domain-containing protein n=1 Tax=Protaetiibacter larvae TaxID=2592654 RepID=A0A5C1Y490_9MICO|nr:hypothetical protein [Protaetiibacter larvae]QEO08664.1 hypothetical protein FLP23_00635 [Protaetiibacter larvae]